MLHLNHFNESLIDDPDIQQVRRYLRLLKAGVNIRIKFESKR